jgi:hypothetical protein
MRAVPSIFVLSVFVLATARLLGACSQAYVESTPMQLHEGNDAANYQRVFDKPPPADVRVLHSIVATYEFRLGEARRPPSRVSQQALILRVNTASRTPFTAIVARVGHRA